jgi:hypothetical protein
VHLRASTIDEPQENLNHALMTIRNLPAITLDCDGNEAETTIDRRDQTR